MVQIKAVLPLAMGGMFGWFTAEWVPNALHSALLLIIGIGFALALAWVRTPSPKPQEER